MTADHQHDSPLPLMVVAGVALAIEVALIRTQRATLSARWKCLAHRHPLLKYALSEAWTVLTTHLEEGMG